MIIKQKSSFTSLEKNISQIIKPIFARKKDNFLVINNLGKNWHKIVGQKCWQFCYPKKIKFSRGKKSNGVLTITSNNSSIAFYIDANSNQIIENIASYYGYKIISEIRIIQELKILAEKPVKIQKKMSPKQQEFINQSTQIIKDEGLKSVLQQLAKSIFK